MTQNLVSYAEFARLAGVTPGAIGQALKASLEPAKSGRRIDANHACALQYVAIKTAPTLESTTDGIDPLYEIALQVARASGRVSAKMLRLALEIGTKRSTRLSDMIKASKIDLSKPAPQEKPPPRPKLDTSSLQPTVMPPPLPPTGAKLPPQPAPVFSNRSQHVQPLEEISSKETWTAKTQALTHARAKPASTAAWDIHNENKKREVPADEPMPQVPENVAQFADMTIREVIEAFGTDVRFFEYLKALQKIESVTQVELKNEQTRGNLVSREAVKTNIILPFDEAHINLLTDGVKQMALDAVSMHKAGEEMLAIEKELEATIGSFLKPVKDKIARGLKRL